MIKLESPRGIYLPFLHIVRLWADLHTWLSSSILSGHDKSEKKNPRLILHNFQSSRGNSPYTRLTVMRMRIFYTRVIWRAPPPAQWMACGSYASPSPRAVYISKNVIESHKKNLIVSYNQ